MKVVVCGSREWSNIHEIRRRLVQLPAEAEIIHGAARGADRIAGFLAEDFGFTVSEFPADWKRHGRKAGALRNRQMLDEAPDLVLAFWDGVSPGTKDTIDEARRRGIAVEVIEAT